MICIVSTIKDISLDFNLFVKHHISLGVCHFYIFLDIGDSSDIHPFLSNSNITFFHFDDDLIHLWKKSNLYNDYKDHLFNEVMARQVLNADLAIGLARSDGYEWLVHIDSDELLYCSHGNLVDYFENFNKSHFTVVNFYNHEAIPESFDITNPFAQVSLFKCNPYLLNKDQLSFFSDRNISLKDYFKFYRNGKSAVKVSSETFPVGVHSFYDSSNETYRSSNVYVLHFPCCGFESFLSKYNNLGHFANHWFGKTKISSVVPVHTLSRDIVASNDIDLAKRFYILIFVNQYLDLHQELIDYKILFRVSLSF